MGKTPTRSSGLGSTPIVIDGTKELDAVLLRIKRSELKKAVRSASSGYLGETAKGIKSAVASAPVTKKGSRLKSEVRRTIGFKYKSGGYNPHTGRTTAHIANVGFGIAQTKEARAKKIQTAMKMRGKRAAKGNTTSGVGVSSQNVHWFVRGTKERRQRTTGREVGKVPAFFKGVLPRGVMASRAAAQARAVRNARRVFERVKAR